MTNFKNLDLNLLVALDILVRERNVTQAGRVMGLSQPAMSNTLARLREALNDAVLVRTPNGMIPTPRALELVEPVRQALGLVSTALARQDEFNPKNARGVFTVAGTDNTAFVLLPKLAQTLHEEAPGLSVDFTSWRGTSTYREVQTGAIDLAIGVGEIDAVPTGLYKKRLFTERFVCVVRRGHPKVKGTPTVDTYVELPHLLVSPRGGRTGVVDTALAQVNKQRHVAFVVPHFLLAPIMVSETDYIVTLSELVARPFAKLLPLDLYPPPVDIPAGDWFCLWHERTHKDPAQKWFRQRVLDLAAEAIRSCEGATEAKSA